MNPNHSTSIVGKLEAKAWQVTGVGILRLGFGLVLVFRAITEWAYSDFLYTPNWLEPAQAFLVGKVMLTTWLVTGTMMLLGWHTRIAASLALVAFLVAEKSTIVHDGGDNVLRLVLLHMVFMLEGAQLRSARGFPVFVHNLAVLATLVQLCIVYFVAGTLKLQGDIWVNGTALYYVMHVNMYSLDWPWLREVMKNPLVVTVGSYAAILYQVGFPFMLLNRLHLPWLVLGLGFHLGIVVLMGLTTFGTIMVSLALFTIRDSEWTAIHTWVQTMVSRRNRDQSRLPTWAINNQASD